jgi:hypothetical protein
MTKIGLIITLGTRDIQLDKTKLEQLKKDAPQAVDEKGNLLPRPFGKFLCEEAHYKAYQSSLSFPILDQVLDYIKIQNPGTIPYKGVMLIVTDQPESVGTDYYNRDTVYYAEILKKYKLSKGYGDIKTQKVDGSVNLLDDMFEAFGKMINTSKYDLFNECDTVYLCNQSGIDAINTGLMLNAIIKYGEKLKTINVDQKNQLALEVQTTKLFLTLFQKQEAIRLIKRYDYAAIAEMKLLPKPVIECCLYAFYRLNFNFEEARRTIMNSSLSNEKKLEFAKAVRIYEDDQDQDNAQKIKELFHNAYIRFEQGAYIDFLLRSFRMLEEKLKLLVQEKLGFKFEDFKFDHAIQTIEQKDPHLIAYLDNYQNPNGEKLRYREEKNPNNTILFAVLSYYLPEDDSLFRCLKALKSLSELRNKSIGAHGFLPVSQETLDEAVKNYQFDSCHNFLDELRKELDAGDNPFVEINNWLKTQLNPIKPN